MTNFWETFHGNLSFIYHQIFCQKSAGSKSPIYILLRTLLLAPRALSLTKVWYKYWPKNVFLIIVHSLFWLLYEIVPCFVSRFGFNCSCLEQNLYKLLIGQRNACFGCTKLWIDSVDMHCSTRIIVPHECCWPHQLQRQQGLWHFPNQQLLLVAAIQWPFLLQRMQIEL